MASEAGKVVISCPDCNTHTDVSVDEVTESLERHNENLHDGEDVATVDPRFVDELAGDSGGER